MTDTAKQLRESAAEFRKLAAKDPHGRAREISQADHRAAQKLEAQTRKNGK